MASQFSPPPPQQHQQPQFPVVSVGDRYETRLQMESTLRFQMAREGRTVIVANRGTQRTEGNFEDRPVYYSCKNKKQCAFRCKLMVLGGMYEVTAMQPHTCVKGSDTSRSVVGAAIVEPLIRNAMRAVKLPSYNALVDLVYRKTGVRVNRGVMCLARKLALKNLQTMNSEVLVGALDAPKAPLSEEGKRKYALMRHAVAWVQKELAGQDGSHDFWHIYRVVTLALSLAREEIESTQWHSPGFETGDSGVVVVGQKRGRSRQPAFAVKRHRAGSFYDSMDVNSLVTKAPSNRTAMHRLVAPFPWNRPDTSSHGTGSNPFDEVIHRICVSSIPGSMDLELVFLAALLHDIKDHKYSGSEHAGPEAIWAFLQSHNYNPVKAAQIVWIVQNVGFTKEMKKVNAAFSGDGAHPSGESKHDVPMTGTYKNVKFPLPRHELSVVQDADRLDAVGAIGIARTFTYGGYKQRPFFDPRAPPKVPPHVEFVTAPGDKRVASDRSNVPGSIELPCTINHFYEKLLFLVTMMKSQAGRRRAILRQKFMVQFLDRFMSEWRGAC